MISETRMWYGSSVLRQGRSRPWRRYQASSRERKRRRSGGAGLGSGAGFLSDPADKSANRVTKAALGDEDVTRLEQLIDRLETEVPPLRRFILAGGTPAGAALHVARTVCRRAERRIVSLMPAADPILLRYLNRLSD